MSLVYQDKAIRVPELKYIVGPYHKKVLIYIEHHSECPLVGIGTPLTLEPQASVPSPVPKGGGGTLACC